MHHIRVYMGTSINDSRFFKIFVLIPSALTGPSLWTDRTISWGQLVFSEFFSRLAFVHTSRSRIYPNFFQLICWLHPGCIAAEPEVKKCQIKIFSMLEEMLMVQYQGQSQNDISISLFKPLSGFVADYWLAFFGTFNRLKSRECNKLETLRMLFGTHLDG